MENKYNLYIIIILIVLALAGGIYIFASKKPSENQTLATATPSATIEPSPETTATVSAKTKTTTTMDGLKIEDERLGTGAEATVGKMITVNYAGTLVDGTQFDSSYGKSPFVFSLGAGDVIKGWDQGFAGMKVGGKRKLTIPSDLAYGPNGIPGAIPGGATLIFEVELLKVE